MSYFPEDYRYYLQAEFNARLKRRPHYSMRAFARDLGMGASTLVEFMKGKAGFSRSRAQFVASKLRLSPEHSSHFWFLVQEKFSKKSEEKKFARVQLTQKNLGRPWETNRK